jgi:hypothetical protein
MPIKLAAKTLLGNTEWAGSQTLWSFNVPVKLVSRDYKRLSYTYNITSANENKKIDGKNYS